MKKTELLALRLPSDLREKLTTRAQREERSESAIIRIALKKFLSHESSKVKQTA